jgi:GT2 family glycosyltransferase/2-polyprenyl-3-methyl-5-hydroxy-6-metoxy-1,4-benzoquinol methylase/glycosyltransferase involved in cell wall biosynthesis
MSPDPPKLRPAERIDHEPAPAGAERYEQEIDVDSDSTHARVVRLAGINKTVLELGCATGSMSRALHNRGCRVTGVELDTAAAEKARPHCERVIIADLDSDDWQSGLQPHGFDVIIAADVLEHLKDPARVLRELWRYLKSDGVLVASIPNIAHGAVRLALLSGRFDYSETGLLDRTHLRFFTADSLKALFVETGFALTHIERVEIDLDGTEVRFERNEVPADVYQAVANDPESRTYQFVVSAVPIRSAAPDIVEARFRELVTATDRARGEAEQASREIAALQQQLEDRTAAIQFFEQRHGNLKAAQTMIAELEARASAREAEIAQLKRDLEARAAEIVPLRQMVRENQDELAALRDRTQTSDALIAELKRQLATRSAEVPELRRLLLVHHNELQTLQQNMAETAARYEAELVRRSDARISAEGRNTELTAALDKERTRVEALQTALGERQHVEEQTAREGELIREMDRRSSEEKIRQRRLQTLELQTAQQAEAVAWLRGEVQVRVEQLQKIHSSRMWRTTAVYWGMRSAAKNAAKAAINAGRRLLSPRSPKTNTGVSSAPQLNTASSAEPKQVAAPARAVPRKYDVICFSIIDWEFRWQRPQQMMAHFAADGHRVFFISTSRFTRPGQQSIDVIPLRDNVWEVRVSAAEPIDVYSGKLADPSRDSVIATLQQLRREFHISCAVSIVQVATWTPAALAAREEFGWTVAYDCMDEWNMFPGMQQEMIAQEQSLVASADLVIVSARRLLDKWSGAARNIVLANNAADYKHFCDARRSSRLADIEQPVIGYFGAIAPWFDVNLMVAVARSRPQYTFVLLGGVFDVDVRELQALPNVRLLGQQPYEVLPEYLARFDVCMIPFVVNEITAATDPVKFYEYISCGKPVVTAHMPELLPHQDVLYMAADADDFAKKIDTALSESDESLVARRIELARQNTWDDRIATINEALERAHRRTSIIIVTYNNVDITRLCIESVLRNTLCPNTEIIIVDNDSKDTTGTYLSELGRDHANIKTIFNDRNLGFARANNQGIAASTGDVIVLLNNDTVVPNGWLEKLARHVRRPSVGMAVSVTNFSGNESRIAVPYDNLDDMERFADAYTAEHDGEIFDIRVAAMYCVAFRRNVYDRVGTLDEQFSIGMFEDDDYSHRVRLAGFRVVCAEDAFVHHFGRASFGKLASSEYKAIWDHNLEIYERKWGVKWTPHSLRPGLS